MKLAVKNFRCFKNTGDIELNRINLFIGPNGSGKSSFLRILPLFKQSVRTLHSSPILWSYNNYLDFGNFDTTIHNNSKFMTFTFGDINDEMNDIFQRLYGPSKKDLESKKFVRFTIAKNNSFTEYVRNIELEFWGDKIAIHSEKYSNQVKIIKIKINKYVFDFNSSRAIFEQMDNSILPQIDFKDSSIKNRRNYYRYYEQIPNDIKERFINDFGEYKLKLRKKIQEGTLKDYFTRQIPNENVNSKNKFHEVDIYDLLIPSSSVTIYNLNSEDKNKLNAYRVLIFINEYLSYANRLLDDVSNSVRYLAPFRAQAERYYLAQDLIDNELDSRGFNIPSYLTIMKANNNVKFKKLNSWLSSKFNFEIDLKNAGNHTQLRISEKNNISNIADTGFGYSQILPLLVHLWEISESKSDKILIVEQPELHLHPKLQGMFVDVLVDISKSNDKIVFLIETHSETIINRIGQQIRRDATKSKLVNLYITNKENHLEIKKTSYDKDGVILDWPVNFLSAGDIEHDYKD